MPALGGWVQGEGTSLPDLITLLLFFFFFLHFRAVPKTYGGSQAKGQIRATAASLPHSHSNMGSEPCLQPTQQLTAMLDP